jgi:catechol 2,3-dioxygenase-like lactoylglutathione lyase family enzyme
MKLSFYAPVIFVKDIHSASNFYIQFLDQEIEFDFGNNILFKSRLSLWQISPQHEIGQITATADQGNAFELCFETADIAGSAEKIKSAGVRLLHDVKTEPWGQQTIRFFDPDNHLIEIGETMQTFICRIYKETGSVEKTAKQTGVSADLINTYITG